MVKSKNRSFFSINPLWVSAENVDFLKCALIKLRGGKKIAKISKITIN